MFEPDKTLKRMVSFGFYLQPWQTVDYDRYPSVGRFEGDDFNPDTWKSWVPVGALLRARTDDDFWAARRVMAFSDELIRAIVKTGQYSDPKAEEHLGTVLIKRRNKIGQAYLSSHQSFSQFFAHPFICFDVRKCRGENRHGQGTRVLRSHVVGVQQQHWHDEADRRNQRLKRADERSVRLTV